jgi:imidazolonepropionase-like amidohydrolase
MKIFAIRFVRSSFRSIAVLALLLGSIAVEANGGESGGSKSRPPLAADLVLFNGKVYTVDQSHSVAQSLALKDDANIYVGDHAGLQQHLGPDTTYVNLKSKLVLPGFVDSHAHPLWAAHGVANYVIADPVADASVGQAGAETDS